MGIGTEVTITGARLLGGGTTLVSVSLAGTEAKISGANDTTVTVTAAEFDGASTNGDVVLISDTGAVVTAPKAFEYTHRGEVLLASPARGQVGTFVTIYGSNLLGGGSVLRRITLGDVEPMEITLANSTLIRLRAGPARSLGLGDILIISDTGSIVTSMNGWTYDIPSNISYVCVIVVHSMFS